MDKELEGAIALAKLKTQFGDRVLDVPQLGALMRKEFPDWSDEQVDALLRDADKSGSGLLRFSDLVDFVLADPPVVVASPGFAAMAAALRQRLGSREDDVVSWERFRSGDPNTRFRWRQLLGRRVVFIFDTSDQSRLFEQLSLLQALQGFPVPDGEDSRSQWKAYAASGRYAWGRAAEIVVVLPWYRPCQMERTSRWHRGEDGDGGGAPPPQARAPPSWSNTEPAGQWLDVPAAQTLVRLLATPGPPFPGPPPPLALDGQALEPLWRPPLELLFLELHEEAPVRRAASDLGVSVRAERLVPHLLAWLLRQPAARRGDLGPSGTFVLFPDKGAYERYLAGAMRELGLAQEHVLWTNKRRTGARVEQGQQLLFRPTASTAEQELVHLGPDDHVLVIDDFTNSGSTLFGAARLVRSLPGAGEGLRISILVPHTVAAYDEGTLRGLLAALEGLGPRCRYVTTDTIPGSARLLRGHPQAEVVPVAEFLAEVLLG